MLQAMVDDSGTRDAKSGVFLLGALVATVCDWMNLASEWDAELSQPPRASYFKLQDAIRANGEYRGASSRPEMLGLKIRKFSEIVQKHVRHAYVVEMSIAKFNALFKPTLESVLLENHKQNNHDLDGIASPYYWLALTLLRGIDYQGFSEETNVVFDDQADEGMDVQKWWPLLVASHNAQSKRVPLVQSKPDYRCDQKFSPLQAANSFAWLSYRDRVRTPLSSLIVEPPSLQDFLGSVPLAPPKIINTQLLKRWNSDLIQDIKRNRANLKA